MRCSSCGTRRGGVSYHRATRLAGGDRRRAGRQVRTTVCSRCVRDGVAYHDRELAHGRAPGAWWRRLSMADLVRVYDHELDRR